MDQIAVARGVLITVFQPSELPLRISVPKLAIIYSNQWQLRFVTQIKILQALFSLTSFYVNFEILK